MKLTFPNGASAELVTEVVAAAIANEFTEDLHPRASDGRFAAAGAGTESAAFKEWFGKSKVVDAEGKPLRVYHGTKARDFTEFDTDLSELGAHFGTKEQASAILPGYFVDDEGNPAPADNARVIPTYLNIQNPIELKDEGLWTTKKVLDQLREKGLFPKKEMDALETFVRSLPNMRTENVAIRDALKSKGIDGIKYTNTNKHEGSGDSWIAFYPEQIKSVFNKGTWSKTDKNISNEGLLTGCRWIGNSDGQPCGESHISADKTCHVGEQAYHVTYSGRLASIARDGLTLDQKRSIGGKSLDGYAKGKVFLSDKEGIGFWHMRAEQFAEAEADDPLKAGMVPVVLRVKKPDAMDTDTEGSRDSSHAAWTVKGAIPPDHIEFFDGKAWRPVTEHKALDPKRGMDEDAEYFHRDSPLIPKEFGNDGGVPCGDSYISSDKVCRVGEGTPRTETKAFKDWFRDSQVKGEDGKPLVVYHGTRAGDFSEFNTDSGKEWTLLDRALGSHFAEQRSVPDAFTAGEYAYASDNYISDDPDSSWYRDDKGQIQYGTGIPVVVKRGDDGRYFPVEPFNAEKHGSSWFGAKKLGDDYALRMLVPNGRTIPVYLSIQNPLVVEPKDREFDQNAISKAAQRLVFPHNKDLFVEATSLNTGMKKEVMSEMWDNFKAGKPGRDGSREWKDMNAFVDDYGTGLVDSHAAIVKRELEKLGYDGVKYKNTSANEVHGGNKWTWIAFRPEQIKSVFNKGTWSKTDKNMSNEPHPRLIGNSAEWEEAEHPRDEAGKFADKGSYGDLVGKKIYINSWDVDPFVATVTKDETTFDARSVRVSATLEGKHAGQPLDTLESASKFYTEEEYENSEQVSAFLSGRKTLFGLSDERQRNREAFIKPFGLWISTGVRSEYKQAIANEIGAEIGVRSDIVSSGIHVWAESSNDTLLSAMILQNEAAAITGGSLSKWQQENLGKLLTRRTQQIAIGYDKYDNEVWLPFERDNTLEKHKGIDPLKATRDYLKVVHNRTQEALQNEGIDTLILYRGCKAVIPEGLKAGSRVHLEMNSLSSWSCNKEVSESFSKGTARDERKLVILKTIVPRKQVFSTARTGFGCLNEKEIVLHNGGLRDRMLECEVIDIR